MPRTLIGLTSFLLAFFSIAQMHNAQAPQPKPNQAIALSDTLTAPDSPALSPASPLPTPQPTPVPVVAPWHGPVVPVSTPLSGPAPAFAKLPVSEPVVFLGIDDGWFQSLENLQWLKAHHLPFSLFLVDSQINNDYGYFKQLQDAGMTIEDHSVTHPDLAKLNLAGQQAQICGAADNYSRVFNRHPMFFRPPYGDYNALTQQAAAVCNIRAIVLWDVVLDNGAIQYQIPATHLEPGDIILMHFQNDLIPNMQTLNNELERDHLQIGRLEDWLH